jgi:hypothetical protein
MDPGLKSTGGDMKFITLCDSTGFIECEIFAEAYRRWGLATIRWPVVEVEATVTPFENGNGYTLDVQRAGKPRPTHGAWRAALSLPLRAADSELTRSVAQLPQEEP